ncbi:4-Cys prefix domain-containing protein [Argonema antarcticum]|uniref:4-Cys prefix domain-containing protein n=1 Tax=Argonema antarcticum TaxID=2942763 RepID=UPI0020135BBF|nr:4-Cys prefix domain-containing protein [Argonema antarcticum]MCL1475764.1 hypothetical protein [Argonema antarcticum A004/B2]
MSYYCINPNCGQRENPENLRFCQTCGTSLFINDRYRLIAPLRELHENYLSEVFEVEDWESDGVDSETVKILKVLKPTNNRTLIRLFRQEVRVLMSLKHPGIPKIEPDGYFTFSLNKS